MKKHLKIFIIIGVIIILGLFMKSLLSKSDKIIIAGQTYLIPKENNKDNYSNDLVDTFMDAYGVEDDPDQISIVFQPYELKDTINNYSEEANGYEIKIKPSLTVIIEPLRYAAEADGWKVRDYVSRDGYPINNIYRLETEENIADSMIKGHFRFHEWDSNFSWLVIDKNPKDKMANVVLSCQEHESVFDPNHFKCTRIYRSKKLQMKYRLYKENYHLYKEIDKFIENKLASWAVQN